MRWLLIVLLALVACSEFPQVDPDAPPVMVDAVCSGESLWGPYSPSEPLYGESCMEGESCRPDRSLPGGWAGICVEGACRPICGFYDNGVSAEQCCLRGGVKGRASNGTCVCVPR